MPLRLSNVILRVADMSRSVSLYGDTLDLPCRFSSAEFSEFDLG
jgi:hypothetical protein